MGGSEALKIVASGDMANGPAVDDMAAFNRLLADWQNTRARSETADPEIEADEESLSRVIDEHTDQTRRVMATPAPSFWHLLRKIEIMEGTLVCQHESGQFNDCRDVVMLGAIKADLLQLSRDSGLAASIPARYSSPWRG